MEEDDTERQELDEIARSEGGLVAVTKVVLRSIVPETFWSRLSHQNFLANLILIETHDIQEVAEAAAIVTECRECSPALRFGSSSSTRNPCLC